MSKIKVLFLSANPSGSLSLKLDEEIRAITEKIYSAKYRDSVELISVWAIRPDDLLQSLLVHRPHVLHFSGHGTSDGELLLNDNNGYPKLVSTTTINNIFTTLKDNLQLVILNACYSQMQAQRIAEVIDCVIGMSHEIGDLTAITFASSFYRAIGFNRSIQEAFDIGRVAIEAEGIYEEKTPQLFTKEGVDPARLFLRNYKPYGYLLLIENGEIIKRFSLTSDKIVIGRLDNDHGGDIQIPERFKKVSRRHATITIDSGNILLDDLGSKNGTYVEGVRVEQTLILKPGQRIMLGSESLYENGVVLEFALDPFGSTD